jgi:hypothetical protein
MGTHVILRRTLALVFLLFLATTVIVAQETNASADVIVLTNGDNISGHLLKAGPESVVLKNDILGIVTIPSSNVSAVKHGNQPSVLQTRIDAKAVAEPALRAADYTLENSQPSSSSSESSSRFDGEQGQGTSRTGKAPSSAAKPADSSIQISLHAPESVMNGTQSQNNFGGAFRLLVRPPDLCDAPNWSTSLLLSGNHSRTWIHAAPLPAITMNQFDGTLSVSNRISKGGPTAFFLVGDMLGNSGLGLALQQSFGGGFSRPLYSSGCGPHPQQNYSLIISGDAGMRYVHDRFNAPEKPVDLASARIGTKVSYIPFRIKPDGSKMPKFVLQMLLWSMPAVNDLRETQAGGTVALMIPFNKNLSLELSEEDDYFSHAPKFHRKNFSMSMVTLNYSFPAGSIIR